MSLGLADARYALLLSAALTACSADRRTPETPRDDRPRFSIATFNVLFSASSDGETVSAIGATRADVVCLQEVNPAWERVLRRRYASRYPYMVLRPAGGSRGLAVLSRFPLEDEGLLAGPRRGFHPAVLVRAETPLGPVRILNVHLRGRAQGKGYFIRKYLSFPAEHEEEVRHLTGAMTAAPAVIAGDFNEEAGGRAVAYLERRGYRNVLPLFAPGAPTWRGRSVAGQLELVVDHLLVARAFEPLEARVVNRGSSDHFPVVATLRAAR